jgi:hypothetical protein
MRVGEALAFSENFWVRARFLPEGGLEESHKRVRERLGIPKSRLFKTQVELGPGN